MELDLGGREVCKGFFGAGNGVIARRVSALGVLTFAAFAFWPSAARGQHLADLGSWNMRPAASSRQVNLSSTVRLKSEPQSCGSRVERGTPATVRGNGIRFGTSLANSSILMTGAGSDRDKACDEASAKGGRFQELSVVPVHSATCALPGALSLAAACGLRPQMYFGSWDSGLLRMGEANSALRVNYRKESFHWGPALLQSFEFLALEHSFRLMNDPYARYLLFHKPFWHDYVASASHFDMSRWGDGDDFVVNYIGHPLQGSVTGNIQIQNDPRGRALKFGNYAEYWKSRLRAMGWAAVYSMYFEIGPGLSEAALGNEGGYTYVPKCGSYPTCKKEPGRDYKPPTNNTGWVDFVVTPLVGTGWLILEDAVEKKIVDPIAKDSSGVRYKLLRAAVSPSRSMSNILQGKAPWFRYGEEGEAEFSGAIRQGDGYKPPFEGYRWEIGAHFANLDLPTDRVGCAGCRNRISGMGLDLSYRFSRSFAFDSEMNFFPGSGSVGGRGRVQQGLFGLKIGRPFRSWGVYGGVRPGYMHYEKALKRGSTSEYESVTRFALDLGTSVEYHASRRSTLRFNLGTTLVRYLTDHADPEQPPVSVLSHDYIVTKGSFHVGSGYVFRF